MYCTVADIINDITEPTLAQLTDDEDGMVVDKGVVNALIEDADALIDGYCGTRCRTPFVPVPPFIASLSRMITIYKLYARRKEDMPLLRDAQYKDAIERLKDISSGKLKLDAAYDIPLVKDSYKVSFVSSGKVFSKETLGGF